MPASNDTAPGADVWAIRPCIYGGRRRERGERFRLAGLPTDARLFEEPYVQRLLPKHKLYPCNRCGKALVGGENFAVHLTDAHGLGRDEARREADSR